MADFSNAFYNRGIAKHNLKDFLGAIQDFDVSEANGLNTSKLYMNRAISRSNIGQETDALTDLDNALDLDSADDMIWQEKGKVLVKVGRLEDAV